MAAIWADLLRLERVGVYDNFFELGGHSLLAVRLGFPGAQRFSVDLPLATLFAGPTIAELAQHIEAAQRGETDDQPQEIPLVEELASSLLAPSVGQGQSLAPLRTGGSAPPLFCIHGLGGHIAAFLPLARGLAQGRPVYGLQGQGLDPGQQPHDRIEDMAAFYLREMREVQPRGPYLLAGWSMGGLIALEAAQQLAAGGEEVSLLAMFDTYLSMPEFEKLDLNEQSVMRWIAPQLNLSARELKKLPLEQQWERIAEQANLAEGIGVAEIRRMAAVCKAHLAACRPLPTAALPGSRRAVPGRGGTRPAGTAVEIALPAVASGARAGQSLQHVAQAERGRVGGASGPISGRGGRREPNEHPMKLILFLLRASWRVVLLAALVGGVSGAASVGLVAMILHTLDTVEKANAAASAELVGLFAALCVVILLTQIGSQVLLSRLTQTSIAQLQMGLCRRILESPLKHLEEIGTPRMLASLTGDVSVVSQAMNGVPVLGVNVVILVCGAVYLGWLSPSLLLGAIVFCVLGMASYWYSAGFAQRYVDRAREEQNTLQQRIQELIEGVKELKMHHARRREFVDEVLQSAETSARRSQFIGDCSATTRRSPGGV